jgi:YfiH family protein
MTPDFLPADWPAPANIRALTTLRAGDDPAAALEYRWRLRETLSLPSDPRWLRQVHGTAVAIEPGQDMPEADAAVTTDDGVVLAILTADCLPVLFCNKAGSEIAAAHAGWRGLAAGVLEATVAAMASSPEKLLAWLGPAAGPEAYEIGEEVRLAFLAHDPDAKSAFVPTRPGHWRVDLYALARQRLAAVGVMQVFGGGLCTISDPQRFYSHRRDQGTGRMASLIWRHD